MALTKTFKALSDNNRVRIIHLLLQKELCVCEITYILNLATSTVSKHLSILKEAGIVIDSKDGKWIDYSINRNNQPELIANIFKNIEKEYKVLHAEDLEKVKSVDRNILCNI